LAKLEKTSEIIDLQKEQEKYDKTLEASQDPVAKRIAEMFGEEIKPMRLLSKGKSTFKKTLTIYSWLHNEIETVSQMKTSPFNNTTETYRAAVHLGALIFMNMYQLKKSDPKIERFLKFRSETDETTYQMHFIDEIVEEEQKLKAMIDKKMISKEIGAKRLKVLKKCFPDGSKEYLETYTKKLFNDENPIHVFEKSTQGRPKSYEED